MTQEDHPNATDYRNRAERAEAELAEVRTEVGRLRVAMLEIETYGDCSAVYIARAALNGGKHD